MIEALRSILGTYSPVDVVQSVSLLNADGDVLQTVENSYSTINVEYVLAAVLFGLALYSLFRVVGSLISSLEVRVR